MPAELFEPFAGGAIVGLTAGFERLAQHVTLVEMDEDVASVWGVVFDGDANALAERIMKFDCTLEAVEEELSGVPDTLEDRAFQTIVRNRVSRGGILAPGAGVIKTGEAGRGIASRWYPSTLRQRIVDIVQIRERFRIIEGDGIEVLRENRSRNDVVYFIDPPYTAGGKRAGSRLYRHSELDHDRLFATVGQLQGDFLMTYDIADEIVELAKRHGFDVEPVPMKNTHHAEMKELLIGRDLSWARQ